MIESKNDTSKNLEKALQALEQAKQRVANEKKKQNEKKRKAENHHKYIMGGIIVKYFPDCYRYDEGELNRILSVALQTRECQQIISKIKSESRETTPPQSTLSNAENESEGGGGMCALRVASFTCMDSCGGRCLPCGSQKEKRQFPFASCACYPLVNFAFRQKPKCGFYLPTKSVSDTKHTVMKRSACCDILYQNIHFLFILCSLSRQLSGNVSDQGRYASSNSGWFR